MVDERSSYARGRALRSPRARAFDLAPGDVLIFSAHMLHRGTYDGAEARLSLDLMVGRPHRRSAPGPARDELPSAHELAAIRRPRWFELAAAHVRAE